MLGGLGYTLAHPRRAWLANAGFMWSEDHKHWFRPQDGWHLVAHRRIGEIQLVAVYTRSTPELRSGGLSHVTGVPSFDGRFQIDLGEQPLHQLHEDVRRPLLRLDGLGVVELVDQTLIVNVKGPRLDAATVAVLEALRALSLIHI